MAKYKKLISESKKNNRIAQRELYDALFPKLYFVAKRYLHNTEILEEVISDAFINIFKNLGQLKAPEALEAWARRIVVNQCLSYLRQNKELSVSFEETKEAADLSINEDFLHEEDLLKLLQKLPKGSRTVFNLYAIEGFSHKEIAENLGITEGTSKSQLNFARKKLQEEVQHLYFTKVN